MFRNLPLTKCISGAHISLTAHSGQLPFGNTCPLWRDDHGFKVLEWNNILSNQRNNSMVYTLSYVSMSSKKLSLTTAGYFWLYGKPLCLEDSNPRH